MNSAVPVIAVAGSYYALQNGVWFTAGSAQGPWSAATSVPAEIYRIPSSSPLHYVTYAYVYGSDGDQIYVGYTPGYYGTVVHESVVVYQTGYPCDAWVGTYWYGCPTPYGYGAAFGWGAAVGWALAFGWGWDDYWYDPWWGPWGYSPGYYYPAGAIAGNVYGRWGASVVAGTAAGWANPWTGNYGRAGQGAYYNERTGGRGYGYAGRNTNVYTGQSTAAAGGVRYDPQTGRVVAGRGGSASNIYTGEGVAGGSRVVAEHGDRPRNRRDRGRLAHLAGRHGGGRLQERRRGRGRRGRGLHPLRPQQRRRDPRRRRRRERRRLRRQGRPCVQAHGGRLAAGRCGRPVRARGPAGPVTGRRARGARPRLRARPRLAGGFERPGASRDVFERNTYGAGFHGHMGGYRGAGVGMRRR